jgi:hypothetical protein
MISIKGHEFHSAQSSYQSHDLTYQSFYKTHVSHGNNVLSSIAETNSQGLDAFRCLARVQVAPGDADLIEGVVIEYFEATAPVHQHLGEARGAHDRADHEGAVDRGGVVDGKK